MDLKKILSISGKPGLFKMITETKTGVVVESLIDGKRLTAFAHQRISALEEISIFTEGEDMPLKDVMKAIHEKQNGEKAIDHKSSSKQLIEFFTEAIPEYDAERVYTSDIKKIIQWYNILHNKDLLVFSEEENEEEKSKEADNTKDDKADKEDKEKDKKEEKKEEK